jgi:hypothetical protein
MSRSAPHLARQGGRRKEPFRRLVRHSIERVANGGNESGDLDFGIGSILALLAVPGAFASIGASLREEYFFIVLAMVSTGAVAVWKWDAVIPDRRDCVNLAPLPIPARHILYANVAALLFLAGVLSVDVNAASSVLFPLFAGSHSSIGHTVVFFATHLFSVFLASLFGFFIVLAILGLMMAALPYRLFRRCSIYVRCGMVAVLMVALSTSFEITATVQHPSLASRSLIQFLPPVWFLGLCQYLRALAGPATGRLAITAIFASVAAVALAVAGYSLSYRRSFAKSAESIENFASGGRATRRWGRHGATDLLLRTPFERGCYSFTLKTLFRSENHMLIVGGFTGVGIVLASERLFQSAGAGGVDGWPSAALLSIPLIVLYLLLTGLRFSFEIPVMHKANWIFRVRTNPAANECVGLARKVMLAFLIPPLLAIALPAYAFFWGWRVGLIHTAVVAAASVLLIEILLVSFRKIPFTCSAPHFTSNIPLAAFFYLAGFIMFTSLVPAIERKGADEPLWYLAFFVALTGMGLGLTQYRRKMNNLDRRPIFEEQSNIGDLGLEVLNLSWIARDTEDRRKGGQRNGD